MWTHEPSALDAMFSRIGLRYPLRGPGLHTLQQDDPEAVPVLLELLRGPEPNARLAGACGLGELWSWRRAPQHAVGPALKAATQDPDERVRLVADGALRRLEGP
jgi:HEAT repeat protein